MEVIKCPNCGSEKVQELTEEKYACLACDNVFLVHNLSKEFRQADAHISDVHKDLKEEINKIANTSGLSEDALLKKAEEHLRQENWDLAYEVYSKLAEEFPQHSAGWYGKYKALTGNFSQVERYARFVCDGNYIDSDNDTDSEERINFDGSRDIKCALNCSDADKVQIKKEVTHFIKRCAEYGKADIENSIKSLVAVFRDTLNERDNMKNEVAKRKRNDQIKALIPAFIIVILLVLSVMYFMAAGDWLGKVIGVVAFVLVIKYGGRTILNSIGNARTEGKEWGDVLSESAMPLIESMDSQVNTLMLYCVDLDNYNHILKSVQNEEQFIQSYITNPLEGLTFYSEVSESEEKFIFDLLSGRIERYKYLIESDN